jgi:hypothetical protein
MTTLVGQSSPVKEVVETGMEVVRRGRRRVRAIEWRDSIAVSLMAGFDQVVWGGRLRYSFEV